MAAGVFVYVSEATRANRQFMPGVRHIELTWRPLTRIAIAIRIAISVKKQ